MKREPSSHAALVRPRPHAQGFTILEILVAAAVLILILGVLLQLSGNTLQATKASQRQMESAQRARSIADALSADLDNLIVTEGAGLYVRANGQSLDLAFLTRSRGPLGTADLRALAVVYTLSGTHMTRRTVSVPWSETDLVGAALSALSSANVSTLSEGILNFQISFVLSTGELVPFAATANWASDTVRGKTLADDFYALTLPSSNGTATSVQALIFSLASLDVQTSSLPEATNLATALSDVEVPTGQTPREAWDAAITTGELNNFPNQLRAALRTTQFTWQLR